MGAEGRWRDLGFVDCAKIKQSQPILRASLLLNALEINIERPAHIETSLTCSLDWSMEH